MIFSELHSAYYRTMTALLKEAMAHPLETKEMRCIVEKYAFGESMLHILPAIEEQRWQLLTPNGGTPLQNVPEMPLTILEKRWLKAIANDPRIRLFCDETIDFPDVTPLFSPEDILVFDHYTDGDDYTNDTYIQHFRLILDAIRNQYPLQITIKNRREKNVTIHMMPDHLEYSEKDDKFRVIGKTKRYGSTINLGRIIHCVRCQDFMTTQTEKHSRQKHVVFELIDQRKSLERVLLHFAHCEKQAEKLDNRHYRITIMYDSEDETEMVIRILSFGPMIKVTAPEHFVNLMKDRLLHQKSCEL